jgi:hypothetical protein
MQENQENEFEETISNAEENQLGFEIVSWEVPEYPTHTRPHWWYIVYAIVTIGFIVYALANNNFLFAIILVVASLVVILNDARTPRNVLVSITTEGVIVGNQFFDYDEIKHFAVIYKPGQDLKKLYFQFKALTKHRLSIGLYDVNPLFLRENLMKYLPEDLDRTHEPLSEVLSRILKL